MLLELHAEPDTPWPIQLEDHRYRRHELTLAPGQMLLHESARLPCGRPRPLDGRLRASVVATFEPLDG